MPVVVLNRLGDVVLGGTFAEKAGCVDREGSRQGGRPAELSKSVGVEEGENHHFHSPFIFHNSLQTTIAGSVKMQL